jgi:pyridoxine 5-phosphate synthase
MTAAGIEVSLFIAPIRPKSGGPDGAGFVELHGCVCGAVWGCGSPAPGIGQLVGPLVRPGLGLRVNAGHGLNYENLPALHAVPYLEELNIGHSIVSRAVFTGLAQAVRDMLRLMEGYPG